MTATTILAIDLGKYKCVACAYDRGTAAAEFQTVAAVAAQLTSLRVSAQPAARTTSRSALHSARPPLARLFRSVPTVGMRREGYSTLPRT